MHYSSMERMKQFVNEHDLLNGRTIIDVGAYDLNGSYRIIFDGSKSKYFATDIIEGGGVDFLIESERWNELKEKVDAVISGQTFEHVENLSLLLKQIKDILKPGGLFCAIAPSSGPAHPPTWQRHFSVESMTEYISEAGFNVLSCTIDPTPEWHDCCCVAMRPRGLNEDK